MLQPVYHSYTFAVFSVLSVTVKRHCFIETVGRFHTKQDREQDLIYFCSMQYFYSRLAGLIWSLWVTADSVRNRSGLHPLKRKAEQLLLTMLSLFMHTHLAHLFKLPCFTRTFTAAWTIPIPFFLFINSITNIGLFKETPDILQWLKSKKNSSRPSSIAN